MTNSGAIGTTGTRIQLNRRGCQEVQSEFLGVSEPTRDYRATPTWSLTRWMRAAPLEPGNIPIYRERIGSAPADSAVTSHGLWSGNSTGGATKWKSWPTEPSGIYSDKKGSESRPIWSLDKGDEIQFYHQQGKLAYFKNGKLRVEDRLLHPSQRSQQEHRSYHDDHDLRDHEDWPLPHRIDRDVGCLEPALTQEMARWQKSEEKKWRRLSLQVPCSARGPECERPERPVQPAQALRSWPPPPPARWVGRSTEQPGNGKLKRPTTGPTPTTVSWSSPGQEPWDGLLHPTDRPRQPAGRLRVELRQLGQTVRRAADWTAVQWRRESPHSQEQPVCHSQLPSMGCPNTVAKETRATLAETYTSSPTPATVYLAAGRTVKSSHAQPQCHSSGAVWESRWPSWAVRPNEPSGFRGRKAILNHASALVSACVNWHLRTLSNTTYLPAPVTTGHAGRRRRGAKHRWGKCRGRNWRTTRCRLLNREHRSHKPFCIWWCQWDAEHRRQQHGSPSHPWRRSCRRRTKHPRHCIQQHHTAQDSNEEVAVTGMPDNIQHLSRRLQHL